MKSLTAPHFQWFLANQKLLFRQSFFSDLINKNINNSRLLFSTIDRLTNPRMEIAPELISTQKCYEFALFFTEKILKIRQDINSSIPSLDPFPLQGQIINEANISECVPVRHKTLEDIIFHLRTTTCSLDSLPTNFFKNVYCYIASDVLQIVNMSLHSGDFPKGLKTAVIKPLLKKNTLDTLAIGNYRPISNLPFLSKIIEKVVYLQQFFDLQ